MGNELAKFYFSGEQEKRCPARDCANHRHPEPQSFLRKGYYTTKWNGQPVRRWRCRGCGRSFSSHTFRSYYRQHRPELNNAIFQLYSSGMTQRRMALVLKANRKTVVRKFRYLALLCRKHHRAVVRGGGIRTSHVQFDEMETFEHTKLKPVTIALAVRAKTGEIVDMRAAQLGYKGRLAELALRKYGPRPSRAKEAAARCLKKVAHCAKPTLTLTTDSHPAYPGWIQEHLPLATHRRTLRRLPEVKTDRKNKDDALFTLNYTCAKIRNDLSRMTRKTWVTTKRIARLQAHLNLYLAWNNRYQIAM